jgi:hypothetical protein
LLIRQFFQLGCAKQVRRPDDEPIPAHDAARLVVGILQAQRRLLERLGGAGEFIASVAAQSGKRRRRQETGQHRGWP